VSTLRTDDPAAHSRPIGVRALVGLLLVLVCSGFAGLTYQVLWLRLLSIVFGVTAYAASTVLAAFMAGLALGSVLAGRLASRAARPLRLFAAAELAIAVTALASMALLERLPAWYGATQTWLGQDIGTLTVARFIGAFLVLVVPTSIMGATLPLVSASLVVRERTPAARVSAVYAANTAGAILGAGVTGIYLIGAVGVTASFRVAAAANALAAAGALCISWLVERSSTRSAARAADERPLAAAGGSVPSVASQSARRVVLFVLFSPVWHHSRSKSSGSGSSFSSSPRRPTRSPSCWPRCSAGLPLEAGSP
jgi:spermidine synthase